MSAHSEYPHPDSRFRPPRRSPGLSAVSTWNLIACRGEAAVPEPGWAGLRQVLWRVPAHTLVLPALATWTVEVPSSSRLAQSNQAFHPPESVSAIFVWKRDNIDLSIRWQPWVQWRQEQATYVCKLSPRYPVKGKWVARPKQDWLTPSSLYHRSSFQYIHWLHMSSLHRFSCSPFFQSWLHEHKCTHSSTDQARCTSRACRGKVDVTPQWLSREDAA